MASAARAKAAKRRGAAQGGRGNEHASTEKVERPKIEPLDPRLRIELPAFEGPLDLLLFLIQKHELEILDLPVAFITERYLSYLHMMQQLDLDIAAEYLVMAATLAHIKSRMLVPQHDDDDEDSGEAEEEQDPREELIRRLLEYQKYKHAAESLGERPIAGRDVFGRGIAPPKAEGPPELAPVSVFALVGALEKVLARVDQARSFEVDADRISLSDRIASVTERVRRGGQVEFTHLFDDVSSRYDVVITLLAVLEMAKTGLVAIYQGGFVSSIYVESKISDTEEEVKADEDAAMTSTSPDQDSPESEVS